MGKKIIHDNDQNYNPVSNIFWKNIDLNGNFCMSSGQQPISFLFHRVVCSWGPGIAASQLVSPPYSEMRTSEPFGLVNPQLLPVFSRQKCTFRFLFFRRCWKFGFFLDLIIFKFWQLIHILKECCVTQGKQDWELVISLLRLSFSLWVHHHSEDCNNNKVDNSYCIKYYVPGTSLSIWHISI